MYLKRDIFGMSKKLCYYERKGGRDKKSLEKHMEAALHSDDDDDVRVCVCVCMRVRVRVRV